MNPVRIAFSVWVRVGVPADFPLSVSDAGVLTGYDRNKLEVRVEPPRLLSVRPIHGSAKPGDRLALKVVAGDRAEEFEFVVLEENVPPGARRAAT